MATHRIVSNKDVKRAAVEVEKHPDSVALSLLAHEILFRQAERRILYAGKEYMLTCAQEYGIDYQKAQTTCGNLLTILERGPDTNVEWALIAAFAVRGFGNRLLVKSSSEQTELIEKFVSHTDWLEVCTPYRIYPFVGLLLSESLSQSIYNSLAKTILSEDRQAHEGDAAFRAFNAMRLTVLTEAKNKSAKEVLERIALSTTDLFTRVYALTILGGDRPTINSRVSGYKGHIPEGTFHMIVRWISGWALLSWLIRLVLRTVGYREEMELLLNQKSIKICQRKKLLGRIVRESDEVFPLGSLQWGGRYVRYPALHLLIGALSLSFGVLMGGMFLFDGMFAGDIVLIAAAFIVLLGAGLDLVLDTLLPGRVGRITMELCLQKGRKLQIKGAPLEDAEDFLTVLSKLLDSRIEK